MTAYSPADLAEQLKSGLLSFPVTHFTPDLELDLDAYRQHLAWLAEHPVAGLFAAGGTGEGFSLSLAETDAVVRAAVSEVAGRTPVLAPATGATVNAVAQARAAADAGADGILLMPPYLTEAGQDGLYEHVSRVCEATGLGVVVYSRANAVLHAPTVARLAEANPTLIGFKDGIGNVEQMTRTYATVGDRLMYIGGLPTAETFALPLLQLGVSTYSSALFNFVPEWAVAFYDAVRRQDTDEVYRRLREFVLPYLDIRDRTPGYAVSIVKAGLEAIGRPAGPVRPPLTDLRPDERAELATLVERTRLVETAR
ncbi:MULTISPECIES: 5-dehydro-4-deoxyglucarate dehydratase [Janibacter]|uniref:Probable 5-dehydro-4-deoxyglucarate dehydratase n=1 Tax=Janibacter melonis TaxID=262209 RepID=A0A176QG59_9MICO|nr:5-dehydro-4-deoxyglucarate dehydratase [Janibacter melonis]MCB5991963.1 5-dehydro-4-deoxyglucarate dehydratase [Janibacter melonis]MCM3555464.1 5-dehydro-4-deoxyglucarate dehydratase [Janibacter melonis]OAB88786.1 5-dehydro-4-deoxyglucarate dehydratase [Janibacter melonis]QGX08601.1 5-dehydro-4-deoxyglucarate dehydratase [Janibacter melonis]